MEDWTFICQNSACTTGSFTQTIERLSYQCPECHHLAYAPSPEASPSETPHAAVVLVLDGGGIRGLSTLFIEEALMKEVGLELERQQVVINDEPNPSDYFTFMIGTSTGGIIATLQGIFGLNVTKCIEQYKTLGKSIFGRPRHFYVRQALLPRSKYDSDDFEELISHFVAGENDDGQPNNLPKHTSLDYSKKFIRTRYNRVRRKIWPQNVDTAREEDIIPPQQRFDRSGGYCKTAVVATRHGEAGQSSFLFRSYDHERKARHGNRDIRNPGKASEASIVEVVRATSAAPSYFKEKKIPSRRLHLEAETSNLDHEERFIDGGTNANNPSDLAWDEVCAWQIGVSGKVFDSASNAIGCIVSIGCGRTKWQMFANTTDSAFRKYLRITLSLSKLVTDTGPSHRATRARARESHVPYFRFNVQQGLEDTKLDEWDTKKRKLDNQPLGDDKKMSTFDFIKEVTCHYLQGTSIKTADGDDRPDIPVEDEIKECAKLLVQYKLARDRVQNSNGVAETGSSDPQVGSSSSTRQADDQDG